MSMSEPTNTSLFLNPNRSIINSGEVYFQSSLDPQEWLYIELQGEIQSTLGHGKMRDSELKYLWNEYLGSFIEHESGECTLQIGTLLLTGKRKLLSKPMVLLLPVDPSLKSDETNELRNPFLIQDRLLSDIATSQSHRNLQKEMQVVGVVKSQILFNERPTPIITSL